MRLPSKKSLILILVLTVFGGIAFQIYKVYISARQTISAERARLLEQNRVPFEKKVLTPHSSQKIRILQNTSETRAFIKFQDSYFAATSGGLVQYDETGRPEKHFTVLDGLPESDLTALALYQNKLFIGTRTKNFLTFDGDKFENYIWTDRQSQAVTSFLESDGKLLIGTFNGGLIEFDGDKFTEIKANDRRISAINILFRNDSKLAVGTFDNGLKIYEKGIWKEYSTAENLPSNRIVGIAQRDKNLYVATDFGLVVLQENAFPNLVTLPAISGLISKNNQLLLTKDDGGIYVFESSLREFSVNESKMQKAHLVSTNEKLWLVSNKGISEINGTKIKSFNQAENHTLTDNFISALTFDKYENLWIGTFRNGIDVFSPEGKKLKHLESETVREINYLQRKGDTISAATSGGLVNFKNDFSSEEIAKKDNLPSNSITHFSEDFTATAKGLFFHQNGKIHLISAVNGLPNNSTYTTLQIGQKLYAGTLGGLAQIENNRVVRTFKDSNSNLTTNWITALCHADERIFIGTYGGGIFELLPSGEILSFEPETGKFVVNPNALYSNGTRLYAGTLSGVKILDLQTQEWKSARDILPSETVMSITGDEKNIYFGTTNGLAIVEKSYFADGENK
jgi:ligand-binding sensor domain-containing protein